MKYLSVCSGIEAASVAFHPLGWECVGVSEIEPFPCAVLAHHYQNVPNFGDMTKFRDWPEMDFDVLVGGTPCQSFSVAGLRKGLQDPRGNLMLTYLGIVDRYKPKFLLWENVPGVLSSNKGADFAVFLDGLEELGYIADVDILDAQHFGLAQRRRRVFVCAQSRDYLLSSRTISSALTISQCLAEILVLILAVARSRSVTGLRGLAFDATKPINSLQRRTRLFCLQKDGAALILQNSLGAIRASYVSEHVASVSHAGKSGLEDSKISGGTKYPKSSEGMEAWREECLSTEPSLRSTLGEVLKIVSECITSTSESEITESKIFTCAKALLNIAAPITQSMGSSPSFWTATLSVSTAMKEFTNYARCSSSDFSTDVGWVRNWDDFLRQADRACESFSNFRAWQHGQEVFPIAAGLRRDIAPRRETGQEVTHATAPFLTSSGRGVERTGDTRGQDPVVAVGGERVGLETTAYSFDALSSNSMKSANPNSGCRAVEVCKTLDTSRGLDPSCNQGGIAVAHTQVFALAGNTIGRSPANGGNGTGYDDTGVSYTLTKTDVHGVCVTGDVAHTLRSEGFDASEDGNGRGTPVVAFGVAESPHVGHCLRSGASKADKHESTTYVAHCRDVAGTLTQNYGKQPDSSDTALGPNVIAFQERGRAEGMSLEIGGDVAYALTAPNGGGRAQERNILTPAMQVRRLTPVECARLQGFPDTYLDITFKKKPATDGHKYKALGNSMAVPVMGWIGQRIQLAVSEGLV